MKEQVANLVNKEIESLNVFVDDAFVSTEEGKKLFNIVLDSEEVIDLNKITEASRIINTIMDKHEEVLGDCLTTTEAIFQDDKKEKLQF